MKREIVSGFQNWPIASQYRLANTVQNANPIFVEVYIRDLLVHQLDIKKDKICYQLLCKKYEFKGSTITTLIRKITCLFDELVVWVDLEGYITAVNKIRVLQKKWKILKVELQQSHAGHEFENYLNTMDFTIYNEEKLLVFLNSDTMYGLFFKALAIQNNLSELAPNYISKRGDYTWISLSYDTDTITEHHVLKNDILIECVKNSNHLNYEVLWLGSIE